MTDYGLLYAADGERVVPLVTIDYYVHGLARRIAAAGLPALRLSAGQHQFDAGDGEPGAHVTAEPFELARMLGGRRTLDEMRALHWDGDPEPYLPLLSNYGTPSQPLGER